MNALRPSAKPRRQNSHRDLEGKRCPQFLQFLRGRECLFAGISQCEGKIEAMHLDFAGGKGVATKVADKYAVPCCQGHHSRQHRIGWATFLRETGLSKGNLLDAAAFLWSRWPGLRDWERKLTNG